MMGWRAEDGTALPWMLLLTGLLLGVGGLAVDLSRAYSDYRTTAAIVDAAATAGATAVDQPQLRATRLPRLVPDAAAARAADSLAAHSETVDDPQITVAADGSQITVTASRTVPSTLLRLLTVFDPDSPGRLDELTVTATAVGTPQRGVAR